MGLFDIRFGFESNMVMKGFVCGFSRFWLLWTYLASFIHCLLGIIHFEYRVGSSIPDVAKEYME